jgi:hypothetical protein
VWCPPDVVARLLSSPAPATVAPYVVRPVAAVVDESSRFDVGYLPDGSVESAGNGLCVVQRHVIERLWDEYREELWFEDDFGRHLVHLWRDLFGPKRSGARQVLGEDVCFWWRVRSKGFRIEALDNVEVTHASTKRTYRRAA